VAVVVVVVVVDVNVDVDVDVNLSSRRIRIICCGVECQEPIRRRTRNVAEYETQVCTHSTGTDDVGVGVVVGVGVSFGVSSNEL